MKTWRPFVAVDLPDAEVTEADGKPSGGGRSTGPTPGLLVLLSLLSVVPVLLLLGGMPGGLIWLLFGLVLGAPIWFVRHAARSDKAGALSERSTWLDRTLVGRTFSGGEWDDRPVQSASAVDEPADTDRRVVIHRRSDRKTRRPSVISRG